VNGLRIAPIVEGHGEDQCIRTLLERVWRELIGGEFLDVLKPLRSKRHRLVKEPELQKAVTFAASKLAATGGPGCVLVLLDADRDPPCILGPQLLATARKARSNVEIVCIAANVEYETWFVAAAESLTKYLDLGQESVPENPEQLRLGKHWIAERFKGTRYSETQDQPRMTAAMDLALCRRRSPSFDKLCRELARLAAVFR
jgi:hypothetical protein